MEGRLFEASIVHNLPSGQTSRGDGGWRNYEGRYIAASTNPDFSCLYCVIFLPFNARYRGVINSSSSVGLYCALILCVVQKFPVNGWNAVPILNMFL